MVIRAISRRQFVFTALGSVASVLSGYPADVEQTSAAKDSGDVLMQRYGFIRYRPMGVGHRIYKKGKGPAVLILHELPGLSLDDIGLACRVAESGFTAVVPVFFGKPGSDHRIRNLLTQCFVPFTPFHCWVPGITSRVANWLATLVPELYRECGGKGVGVIGMCLTGSLPLALLKVPAVKAAVLCQPTNPFLLKHHLDISRGDLQAAIDRDDLTVLAVKFSGDGKSPHQRFQTLHEKLKGHFNELIINSGRESEPLSGAQHSVLGGGYDSGPTASATREAFNRVIRYLDQRLSDPPTRAPYPLLGEECAPEMFTSCQTY